MHPTVHDPAHIKGVRTVATVELIKGIVVVLVGLGALSMRHKDFWGLADSFLHFLDIHPHYHRLVGVFTSLISKAHDVRLWQVALIAVVYVILRFVEAYGLWYALPWAEWMAFLSGGVYIPFEAVDLIHKPTLLRFGVIAVNALVVLYMLHLRVQAAEKRHAERKQSHSDPRH
jgi:uncharacterized membrane protein (DUF2068 family)